MLRRSLTYGRSTLSSFVVLALHMASFGSIGAVQHKANSTGDGAEYTREAVLKYLQRAIRLPRKSENTIAKTGSNIGPVFEPTLISKKYDAAKNILWEQWTLRSEPSKQGLIPLLVARPPDDKHSSNQKAYPCVIVSHGTGSNKNQMEPYLASLVAHGFIGLAFDSRYHGDRAKHPINDYYAALVRSYVQKGLVERPFIYDTIHDVQHILTFLGNRKDILDVGMTGISLGGMHTWFASAVDDRIAAAVPFIGVQNFRYAMENNLYHSRVESLMPVFEHGRKQLGKSTINPIVVENVWNTINPGLIDILDAENTLRLIAPRPLFIMNGEADLRTPKIGVDQAFETCKKEYGKHYGRDKMNEFLKYYVNPKGEHTVDRVMWQKAISFFKIHLIQDRRQMVSKGFSSDL